MKTTSATPEEARAISREAYLYGFPMVETYKTLHKQAIDKTSTDYKAPLNQLGHFRTVATPEDTFVVTPNSDTPYSLAWLDLRPEPMVITLPKIEPDRYYSVQLIDLYTHNFGYLGTRSFGNEGGDFLIAGPDWRGEKPAGIRAVIPCETQIMYAFFRTQLFNPGDIKNVHQIQDAYRVRPLSLYLGNSAPPGAPAVDWPPLVEGMSESAQVFSLPEFSPAVLPHAPFGKGTDGALRPSWASAPANPYSDQELAPRDQRKPSQKGLPLSGKRILTRLMKRVNAGELTSGDLFGTREFLKNNYLYRFAGAKLGLYGNLPRGSLLSPVFCRRAGRQTGRCEIRLRIAF